MLNLDTHILLYALAGELTTAEHRLLAAHEWSISAIVLWEVSKLAQLGRIEVDLDDAQFIRVLSRIHCWPITLDICRRIPALDFRSDPADEIIAATSLVHDLALVTRDGKLKKSRLLSIAG